MTEDDHLKYRLIYRRFLVILFSFLAVYSFLHWLLVLRLHLVDISEKMGIWFPALLPFIPLWIWLGKRVKLLYLMKDGKSEFPSFLVMGHLAIAATTIAFQPLLISAAGELRALKSPEEITRYEPVKYYTIESFYVDKRHAKFKRFQHRSGKHNRTLNYELVIAVPLYPKIMEEVLMIPDTAALRPRVSGSSVWICLYYETSLSNKSSLAQKENAWELFEMQSEQDLKNTDLNSFTYLDRPGKGAYRNKLVKAAKGWDDDNSSSPHVLEPRFEPFHERTYPQAGLTILIFILGAGMWWLMIYYKSFDTAALDKFMNEQNI